MKLYNINNVPESAPGRPIIDGLLHANSVTSLAGSKTSYTTTTALVLAATVAAGNAFDQTALVAPRSRKVLYLTTADDPRALLRTVARIRDLDEDLLAANLHIGFCPDATPRDGERSPLRSQLSQLDEDRWALIVIDDVSEAFQGLQLQRPIDSVKAHRELRAYLSRYTTSLLVVGRARTHGDVIRNAPHFTESCDIDLRVRRWSSARDKSRNPNKASASLVPTSSKVGPVGNAFTIEIDRGLNISPHSLEEDATCDARELNEPDWCRERAIMNHMLSSVRQGLIGAPSTPAHQHLPKHRVDGVLISDYAIKKLVEDIERQYAVTYTKATHTTRRRFIAIMIQRHGDDMARQYTAADFSEAELDHTNTMEQLANADF